MDLTELRTADAALEEEVEEGEVDETELDTTLEDNLQEACQNLDALLATMEAILYIPKGRKIQRLPRDFKDVMDTAAEFLEDLDYERDGAETDEDE